MTAALTHLFLAVVLMAQGFMFFTASTLGKAVMSTQETVDAVVAQLGRARSEIVAEIGKLNEQIAAAGVAEQVDTSALSAAAQALDDIVPDVPADEAPTEV